MSDAESEMKRLVKWPYYLYVMLPHDVQTWCVYSDKLAVGKFSSSKDGSCVGVDGWSEFQFLSV